jgi:predicted dehydrogenase
MDAASMLRDSGTDIVYVATPSGLHAEHGKQVLDAGKHLWCEKPLTCRLQDTLELLELSRGRGITICEGLMYLHHPHFRTLSGYIAGGRLGSIKSIGCQFGIPKMEYPALGSEPALGGGALYDVACYPISAIQALFPEQNPNVGYARIAPRNGSAVDTDGHAVIVFPNGVVASLEWGINSAYRNQINIWGEKGSVFSDKIFSKPTDHIPVFHFRDAHGAETIEYGEANDHFSSMLRSFRSIIDDLQAAEAERRRIGRRAEMLDRIWSASRSGT